MSKRTVGFIVGGIAAAVVIGVVVYSLIETVPPCSSTQEPDSILEPVADSAAAATCKIIGENNDSLRVFCLVPCAEDECDEEKTFEADYSITEIPSGIEITLTPKAAGEGETVVEVTTLPSSWQEQPTYGDHHFMVYKIGCNEGLSCDNKYYTINESETAETGEIIITFDVP